MDKYKFWKDSSLWILIGVNIYVILYWYFNKYAIDSVLLIYLIQNILIGLFCFFGFFTGSKTNNNTSGVHTYHTLPDGCNALFFLFHYSFFHFMYFVFLMGDKIDPQKVNWKMIAILFWILLAEQLYYFVRNKIWGHNSTASSGMALFIPYLRIIPIHLVILGIAFTHGSYQFTFLVLKMMVDILTYLLYQQFRRHT